MNADLAFRICFCILLAAVLAMRAVFIIKVRKSGEKALPADKNAVRREGNTAFILRAALFFPLIALLALYLIDPPWMRALSFPLPSLLRTAGFVLATLSLLLWCLAQKALGVQWSPQLQLRKKHRLISSGPYKRIRHPIYTAMFGWAAGLSLLTANWVFAAVGCLAVIVLVLRAPVEENMMAERFGEEYMRYMGRTGRFFPKVRNKIKTALRSF